MPTIWREVDQGLLLIIEKSRKGGILFGPDSFILHMGTLLQTCDMSHSDGLL